MKAAISFQPATVLPVAPLLRGAPAYRMTNQIHDQIAQRAFELFCASGRTEGHALQDWCQAEAQLLEPVKLKLSRTKRNSQSNAQLSGFAAREVELSTDSRHLFISARQAGVPFKQGPEAFHPDRGRAVTTVLSKEGLDVVLRRVIVQGQPKAVAKAA